MKIFESRKLTDAEFVEKIRKQTLSAKRRAWILLVFFFFYVGLIVFFWKTEVKHELSQSDFLIGCFVGGFIVFFLMHALMYLAFFFNHLFGCRKEKLLVAYYDRVHSANK